MKRSNGDVAEDNLKYKCVNMERVLDVMEDLPESDDVYYNLNGQRIDNPKKKGLYIQKGRKVVIK